jgi:hypothetical protein
MDLIIISLIVMGVDFAAFLLLEAKFNGKKEPGFERIKN